MLSISKNKKNLILTVIASLLSMIFLAFGIRKRNSSLNAAKEWLYKHLGETGFTGESDFLDDDLDYNHSLNPKLESRGGTNRVRFSWHCDGSKYYVIYISKSPFPENFKIGKRYPSILSAAVGTKEFKFDYQTMEEFNNCTEWIRRIIVESDGKNYGMVRSCDLLHGKFYVLVGTEKGNWSSILEYPSHSHYINPDILKNLKVCYEKKDNYYYFHLIFGEKFKNLPFSNAHLLVKSSVDEIYTYPIDEISECVSIKLKGSNGGLCYFHYFNEFDEPVLKYLEYLPQTYKFENSEWYHNFLSCGEEKIN